MGQGAESRLLRAARQVARVQLGIAIAALTAMLLAIVLDVGMRALVGRPLRGTYDAVGILLLISTFYAFAHVILSRHEIVIDLIDNFVPKRAARLLQRIAAALGAGLLACLLWAMIDPMRQAYAYGDISLELGLPMWIVWALAFVGMAGALLAAAALVVMPVETPAPHAAAVTEAWE